MQLTLVRFILHIYFIICLIIFKFIKVFYLFLDLTHLPKMESIKQELEMPINTKQRITKQKQITSSSPVSFICLICKKGIYNFDKYFY